MDPQEWTNDFELSDEDKQTLSKYESPLLALQGGANAARLAGSPDRVIKNLGTMDLEKLDDKQKETLHGHIAKIQGVPPNRDGYNIERPEILPEGMNWDVGLENMLRDAGHALKAPNSVVNGIAQAYTKRQIKLNEEYERNARDSDEKLKEEWGEEKWTQRVGKPNDPNNIGTIKRCLLTASKELGLDYKDEKGFPQSHLIDCLELRRNGGSIGDKAPLAKFVAWVYDKFIAEGSTLGGQTPSGQLTAEQERIKRNKELFPNTPFMHKL